MQKTQVIRCPNCGSLAKRHFSISSNSNYRYCLGQQITKVECLACDYLLVTCSGNGNVIEAHAPGISVEHSYQKSNYQQSLSSKNGWQFLSNKQSVDIKQVLHQ